MPRRIGSYVLSKEQIESLVKDYDTGKYSMESVSEKYFISPATALRYIRMSRSGVYSQ